MGNIFLDKGPWYLANNVLNDLRKFGFNTLDLLRLGRELLFFHEFFHFVTDIASTVVESAVSFDRMLYTNYFKKEYIQSKMNKDGPIEEALANAFAYNKINRERKQKGGKRRRIRGLEPLIRQFMTNQPLGYMDYHKHLDRQQFSEGRSKLGKAVTECGLSPHPNYSPLQILFDSGLRDISYFDVLVHLVHTIRDQKYVISPFLAIKPNQLTESPKFIELKNKLFRRNPQLTQEYDMLNSAFSITD